MADTSQMIDQYRSKRPFVMTLNTFDNSDKGNDLIISENAKIDAVPASTSTRSSLVTKRKMSLLEYQRTNRNKRKRITRKAPICDVVNQIASTRETDNVIVESKDGLSDVNDGDILLSQLPISLRNGNERENSLSQLSLSQASFCPGTNKESGPLSLS